MLVGIYYIGLCPKGVPTDGIAEVMFKLKVGDIVASGVVVEYAVKTYRLLGNHGGSEFEFGLEGAGCADTYHVKGTMVRLDFASLEVDIGQSVQFVDDDIDIVGAYTVAKTHDWLAAIGATDSVKLSRLDFKGTGVEELGYHVYSSGVADEDDAVGQLLGEEVEMEY